MKQGIVGLAIAAAATLWSAPVAGQEQQGNRWT